MGSSGVVGITRVRAGVVGFIRNRWVHSGSHCGSLGSPGIVRFTQLRAGGRWVHPGSLGSLDLALADVGFALGVVGFMRGRWIHLDSPWGSLDSTGVVGFSRISPGVRLVHPRSLDSLGFALGVVGFIRVRWVH